MHIVLKLPQKHGIFYSSHVGQNGVRLEQRSWFKLD